MLSCCARLSMLVLGGCLLAGTAVAGHGVTPAYWGHRDDPMRQEYSAALLGFAFEKKCGSLTEAERNVSEERLDRASDVFETYLLDQRIVQARRQARPIPRTWPWVQYDLLQRLHAAPTPWNA